jgi:uncharacterized protein YfaP (DUF2135 family)
MPAALCGWRESEMTERHQTAIKNAAAALAAGDKQRAVNICHSAVRDETDATKRLMAGLVLYFEAAELAAELAEIQQTKEAER